MTLKQASYCTLLKLYEKTNPELGSNGTEPILGYLFPAQWIEDMESGWVKVATLLKLDQRQPHLDKKMYRLATDPTWPNFRGCFGQNNLNFWPKHSKNWV